MGRLRPALRDVADDYLRRIGRYGRIEEIECREAASGAGAEPVRRQEAARLRAQCPPGGLMVALDRSGEAWTSETVADQLDRWRTAARPVTLVIGGAHGLDPGLVEAADRRWSLGPLTLPHELARIVVLEQLYRGFTILHRTPYHK